MIEDVSTLSVLDNEIVQSVFPKNDDNLCEITSVIGMTQPGFERLAENEYQRLDKILTFSNSSSGVDWYQDPNYLNKFAARYLNSIRLNEEKVSDISQNRKFGKISHLVNVKPVSIKKNVLTYLDLKNLKMILR